MPLAITPYFPKESDSDLSTELVRRICCYLDDAAYVRNYDLAFFTDKTGLRTFVDRGARFAGHVHWGISLKRDGLERLVPSAGSLPYLEVTAEHTAGEVATELQRHLKMLEDECRLPKDGLFHNSDALPQMNSEDLFSFYRLDGEGFWRNKERTA